MKRFLVGWTQQTSENIKFSRGLSVFFNNSGSMLIFDADPMSYGPACT